MVRDVAGLDTGYHERHFAAAAPAASNKANLATQPRVGTPTTVERPHTRAQQLYSFE